MVSQVSPGDLIRDQAITHDARAEVVVAAEGVDARLPLRR